MTSSEPFVSKLNDMNFDQAEALRALTQEVGSQKDQLQAVEALIEISNWIVKPSNAKSLSAVGANHLYLLCQYLAMQAKNQKKTWIFHFFHHEPEALRKKTESEIKQARFTMLMQKVLEIPNQLDVDEMRELATLIPDMMHHMAHSERRKWLASFANAQFSDFLMNWYTPVSGNVNMQELEAFGELCRQAFIHGELYRLLGQITLKEPALQAIQVELEAELHDSFRHTFVDKVFCRRPHLRIPLDQNRNGTNVKQDTRAKLDDVVAEAVLEVICKRMNHSCTKQLDIKNFAKNAIMRSLEASPGMTELKIELVQSCRSKETAETKRLLNKIESARKGRAKFFELSRKKHFEVTEHDVQESNTELNEMAKWLQTAQGKGIDVTYVCDMVAVVLSNEKGYEASLLSTYLKPLYQELQWMKVSVGFDAALRKNDKQQKAAVQELKKSETLLAERLTLSRLEQLTLLVAELRNFTITPSLVRQVLNEKSNLLAQNEVDKFQNRVNRIQIPKDPNAILALKELVADLYDLLIDRLKLREEASSKLWPSFPVTKTFLDIYEWTWVRPKLTMLESVYQEIPATIFQDISRKADILRKFKMAKNRDHVQENIHELEESLRDAVKTCTQGDPKFLEEHKSCKEFTSSSTGAAAD